MPFLGIKNMFGDLLISVDIKIVEHLSQQESELFEKLASLAEKEMKKFHLH